MKKSITEIIEANRTPAESSYDGIIKSVNAGMAHVQLKGNSRGLVPNIPIEASIVKLCKPGLHCRVERLYDRGGGNTGRLWLTSVTPQEAVSGNYGEEKETDEPPAPKKTTVTVSINCEDGGYDIEWESSPGADEYELYVATDSSGTSSKLINTYDVLAAFWVPDGESYTWFAVKAVNSTGVKSDYSNWATASTGNVTTPMLNVCRSEDGASFKLNITNESAIQYEVQAAVYGDEQATAKTLFEKKPDKFPYRLTFQEVKTVMTGDPLTVVYVFRVRALGCMGQTSTWTGWVLPVDSDGEIIAFGDNYNHGAVDPNDLYKRIRVAHGIVEIAGRDANGIYWVDKSLTIPAPPNTWADETAPTATGLTYTYVTCDDSGKFSITGVWQEPDSGTDKWRSWILSTTDYGLTWQWLTTPRHNGDDVKFDFATGANGWFGDSNYGPSGTDYTYWRGTAPWSPACDDSGPGHWYSDNTHPLGYTESARRVTIIFKQKVSCSAVSIMTMFSGTTGGFDVFTSDDRTNWSHVYGAQTWDSGTLICTYNTATVTIVDKYIKVSISAFNNNWRSPERAIYKTTLHDLATGPLTLRIIYSSASYLLAIANDELMLYDINLSILAKIGDLTDAEYDAGTYTAAISVEAGYGIMNGVLLNGEPYVGEIGPDYIWLYGRFDTTNGTTGLTGVQYIIYSDDGGTTWNSTNLTTSKVSSLKAEGGFWAVSQGNTLYTGQSGLSLNFAATMLSLPATPDALAFYDRVWTYGEGTPQTNMIIDGESRVIPTELVERVTALSLWFPDGAACGGATKPGITVPTEDGDTTVLEPPTDGGIDNGSGGYIPVTDDDGKVAFGDHGDIAGLGDDDHPQYLTTGRGDARYSLSDHVHDQYVTEAEGDVLWIKVGEKGVADGVATLGLDGKIPSEQLPPSSSSTSIVNELLTGTIDAANKEFFTSNPFLSGSTIVRINGLTQLNGTHYTESPSLGKITFVDAPSDVGFTDVLTITFTIA